MDHKIFTTIRAIVGASILALALSEPAHAAPKKDFKVA
jgi:hypothetical protein